MPNSSFRMGMISLRVRDDLVPGRRGQGSYSLADADEQDPGVDGDIRHADELRPALGFDVYAPERGSEFNRP